MGLLSIKALLVTRRCFLRIRREVPIVEFQVGVVQVGTFYKPDDGPCRGLIPAAVNVSVVKTQRT